MKKSLFTLLVVFLSLTIQAQHRAQISTSFNGGLEYHVNGYKATLQTNIFDDLIFKDNRNNQVKFNKDYMEYASHDNDWFQNYKSLLFNTLIQRFKNETNYSETFSVDIFGDLKYEDNKGNRASLKKNIFDELVYSDSKNNEIKISKDYIKSNYKSSPSDKRLRYILFSDLLNNLWDNRQVGIPDNIDTQNNDSWIDDDWDIDVEYSDKHRPHQHKRDYLYEYKDNKGNWATLRENKSMKKTYEDSSGNILTFSVPSWKKQVNRHRTEEAFFNYLTREYLVK